MDNTASLAGILLALRTVAGPAVLSLALAALLARALPRQAAAVAACAGLFLGWALGYGHQAAFPPAQTLDWLPILVAALLVAGLLPRGRTPAMGVILALGLALLVPPLLREESLAVLGGEWGIALALGLGLMALAGRARGDARAPLAVAAALGSLGFVISLGGSIVIGGLANTAFAVAAALGLGAVLCGRLPAAGAGLAQAGVVVWTWLAFSGRHLAEIHLPETLLSAAALATLAFPSAKVPPQGKFARLAWAIVPPAFPALAAIGLTLWRYLSAQQGAYY